MIGFRHAFGACVAAGMIAGCGGSQPPIGAPSGNTSKTVRSHEVFRYTGSEQTFTVPAGVTHLTITARGASGARGYGFLFATPPPGGLGGIVIATIPVTPRERLAIFVGGRGSAGGFNGGGADGGPGCCRGVGGGASDVRQGGDSLADRVIVAAGGGGSGSAGYVALSGSQTGGAGGAGGGSTGEAGQDGQGAFDGGGGAGGTQARGGAGGYGGGGSACDGSDGEFGAGGTGGRYYYSGCGESGGGGGGGYYGGGGGGSSGFGTQTDNYPGAGGGGGGGSSYVEPRATHVTDTAGAAKRGREGEIIISWH